MLLGGLIIVYIVHTLSFLESCYLSVTPVGFFFPPFSLSVLSVLPMLAFISLAFLSMGKHGIEGNPSPQTLYLPGRF